MVCYATHAYSQPVSRNAARNLITIGELSGRTDTEELIRADYAQSYFISNAQRLSDLRLIQNSRRLLLFEVPTLSAGISNPSVRVRYQFFDSEWSLISALILEEIDFARLISEESAREIAKSNHSIHILSELLPKHTVTMVVFNCRLPNFSAKNVRHALSYAIDKHEIINKLLKMRADIAKGPYNRDFEAYESSLDEFRYNPKRAVRLLKENGWNDQNNDGILEDAAGNPLKINLIYQKGLTLEEELIRWIKINWNQIGVDVKPLPLDYSQYQKKLQTGEFDAALINYQFQEDIESMRRFFSKDGARNITGYSSGKVENYIRLYQRLNVKSRQKILFQGIQKTINEDQPVIFLYFKWLVFNFVNRNRIEDYLDADGNLRPLNEWKIKGE